MASYLDEDYAFSRALLDPLVLSERLPHGEGPTADYVAGRLSAAGSIALNFAAVKARALFDPLDQLDEYADLFPVLPRPDATQWWRSDAAFAQQRLSGVHPNGIRRAREVPSAATAEHVDRALARARGRSVAPSARSADSDALFVCDYRELLADMPVGTWERGQKHMPAVAGLFRWRGTQLGVGGELVPVGVQIDGDTFVAPGQPAWPLAKLWLQCADAQVHEMRSHLFMAHLAMEPVAVATGRLLPPHHPVRALLHPHLRFLLFNNDLGKRALINPGGYVDRLLAAPLAGSMEIVKRAAVAWDFTRDAFPNDLAIRGVADKSVLPEYPYREDGMLLWDAIGAYVSAWVAAAWPTPEALADDALLQRWWSSLADPDGASLRGVAPGRTADDLAFVLQNILFTAGPYHAAVNYPQYGCMAFAPNQPLAIYAPWPEKFTGDADLLAALPPFQQAVHQVEIMDLLTSYRHDRFGHYADELPLPWQRELNERFQGALAGVEVKIAARNKTRRAPYPYMLPSLVPNSTSV